MCERDRETTCVCFIECDCFGVCSRKREREKVGRESELERNGVRLGKKDRERKKCVCVRERRRSIIKTLDSVCNKDGRRVVIRISSIVFRLFMSLLCVTLN